MELGRVVGTCYGWNMARQKKINAKRSVKRIDVAPNANGSVVVYTRAGIEARADAIAKDLGVDRKKAFRMLEEGKLRGTVAELRLAPLRFLLS
jgi:hypothetical protein